MIRSNYDGTNLDNFPPQGPPKPLVRRAPGAQFGVGIFARIDCRNLAVLRDEAHRAGDLERASETVQQARRVEQMNAAERGERDAGIGQAERGIAVERGRLKETYERIRTAIDERIRQAGRAIRAGSEAAGRAVRELGKGRSRAWKSRCDNWPGNTHGIGNGGTSRSRN